MNKKLLCASALSLLCLSACSSGASPSPVPSESGSSLSAEFSEDAVKHTVRFYVDGELVKSLSVKDGSKMSAPSSDELPKGYIIEYWYALEGNFKSPWSFSGGTVTSDLDLYADFEYETYTVTLLSRNGNDTYEKSVTYKQEYDFSGNYLGKADHLENEQGEVFGVSGIWTWTHGETLIPVYGEGTINYYFYEIITSFDDDGNEVHEYTRLSDEGVNNPNPKSLPGGKSSDLDVALKDASKEGYRFEGWFKRLGGGNFTELDNLRDGYFGDGVYGLFSRYYSLSVFCSHEGAGRIDFDGGEPLDRACAGDEITVTVTPPNDGYYFCGWYDGGESYVSTDSSYTFKMPSEDYSLIADFGCYNYKISYELDGGVNSCDNPRKYTADDDILLESPTKTGYEFKGWYSDSSYSTKVTSIPQGSTGDKTLYAKWEAILYSLNVFSADEAKGSVTKNSGDGYYGDTMTVEATPAEGYAFKGWYRDGKLVSRANPYAFSMPAEDCSLTARFWTKDESLGIAPFFDTEDGTVTYGLYPQTHVSDESIIASLDALTAPESNGWYLLDGEYYAKRKAVPYGDESFEDGTVIIRGTEYWFKCEPIEWKILSSSNGEYSLVSSALLDIHRFDDSSNCYADSEIREWLNGDFYNSAFSLSDSYVQTTAVDNSASTTDSASSEYACNHTNDKVYLWSYQDWLNADYGFSSDPDKMDAAKYCMGTDWEGAATVYGRNWGFVWTRSPSSDSNRSVWTVLIQYRGGMPYKMWPNDSRFAVRPAVTIKTAQ